MCMHTHTCIPMHTCEPMHMQTPYTHIWEFQCQVSNRTFNFQSCECMANPEDSHPKASWAALWLWYKAVRAVETSHRQRVHPSCLLGYGQGGGGDDGPLWPSHHRTALAEPSQPEPLKVWTVVQFLQSKYGMAFLRNVCFRFTSQVGTPLSSLCLRSQRPET